MNKSIELLLKMKNLAELEHDSKVDAYHKQLKKEFDKVFDNDKALQKAINDSESASEYGNDSSGIYSWFRFSGLSEFKDDAKEFLDEYLSDLGIQVDWDNECLMHYQGESLVIQDDTRHDNGIWLECKLIIPESEYKIEGEVNETLRNKLIEEYMEKTGFYPGVFRVDYYGNVFSVNTLKGGHNV